MFLWYPVMDLARGPRRAARKKGSGYENAEPLSPTSFPGLQCEDEAKHYGAPFVHLLFNTKKLDYFNDL
jgi:hypothetical protein